MYYYSHHIRDFDRATRHLTRIERSVYRDLMDVYYDTEQPLTSDTAALCRKIIARTPEEATAVDMVLAEFFTLTPAGWFHDRCEEELDVYRKSSTQKSIAGKASALARAERRQQALNGNSTAVPTAVERRSNGTSTNHEPITVNHEPVSNNQEPKIKVKTEVGKNNPDIAVIFQIFEFWQKVMMSPKSVLDTNRNRLIAKALKNYSPADICKAIRGCSRTPHNMGQNERNTKYNGLDLILRNAEKIDYFIRLDDNQAKPANETLDQKNQRIIAEVLGDDSSIDSLTIEMEE